MQQQKKKRKRKKNMEHSALQGEFVTIAFRDRTAKDHENSGTSAVDTRGKHAHIWQIGRKPILQQAQEDEDIKGFHANKEG